MNGKLKFNKEEIKVGELYGMYFPEIISEICFTGNQAIMVKLVDKLDGFVKYGLFRPNEDSSWSIFISSTDYDSIKDEFNWYESQASKIA